MGYDGFGDLVQLSLQMVPYLLFLYYFLLEIDQLIPPRGFLPPTRPIRSDLPLGDQRMRLVAEILDLPLLVAVGKGDMVEQMYVGLVIAA